MMNDPRKMELHKALQVIRRWLSEDIIYQGVDYHGEKLNPREHEVRVSLINDALTASQRISILLQEEMDRVSRRYNQKV